MYIVSGVPLPVNMASSGVLHADSGLSPVSIGHQSTVCAPDDSHSSASPAAPDDSIGDGTTFESLDTKPDAQSTP